MNTPRPAESPEIEALKAKARQTLPQAVQEAIRQMDNFEYQDENGVDLTLIESNLRLTPTQRVRKMDAHARALERRRKHVRRIA